MKFVAGRFLKADDGDRPATRLELDIVHFQRAQTHTVGGPRGDWSPASGVETRVQQQSALKNGTPASQSMPDVWMPLIPCGVWGPVKVV